MGTASQLEVDANNSEAGCIDRQCSNKVLVRRIGSSTAHHFAHSPLHHPEHEESWTRSLSELHVIKLLHSRLVN
jgi:hypothetical protein